jgi:CBS domain containing-hemolysin-like protein
MQDRASFTMCTGQGSAPRVRGIAAQRAAAQRAAAMSRWIAALAAIAAPAAHASFLSGEVLDKAADIVAIVVLIVVPIVLIGGFWYVHILPEKVAEARQHPQKEVINVICLLSLFFGGLLWPIAWIMAYSKPVIYKMAYGKDKHDDYYASLDDKAATVLRDDVARLSAELDSLAQRGQLPDELREMHARLTAIQGQVRMPKAGAGEGAG